MADEKKVKAPLKTEDKEKKVPAAKKEAAPKAEKAPAVKKEPAVKVAKAEKAPAVKKEAAPKAEKVEKTEKPATKAATAKEEKVKEVLATKTKEEKPAEVKKVPATQILSKPIVAKGPVPKKAKATVEFDPDARNFRKEREGIVVSNKMQKTIVVEVRDRAKHPLYKKTVNKTKRIKAHDENNECGIGDTVAISECRPLSKDKHWRLVTILEKAK